MQSKVPVRADKGVEDLAQAFRMGQLRVVEAVGASSHPTKIWVYQSGGSNKGLPIANTMCCF